MHLLPMRVCSSFDAAVEHDEQMVAYCGSCQRRKTAVAATSGVTAVAVDAKCNRILQPTVIGRKSN